ncbi:MAG: hypothetical protein M3O61_09095 [Gemmatimonadota bacterium]|nr:hypothetical protein [Gemmatimonadota bacterium]
MTSPLFRGAATLSGVVAALIVLELGLRPLATPDLPPFARPAVDALDAPVVSTRQLEEGIAEANFSAAGARLTGNPTLSGAPLIVVLGDSHVVAREISDGETMGAWIERLARRERYFVNVRQYGWRGASPPRYLLVAGEVRDRWRPAQIVVILDGDDLGADPLNRRFPRMRIGHDDAVELVHSPDANPDTAISGQRFTVAMLARIRWRRVLERAPKNLRAFLNAPVEHRGPAPTPEMIAAVPRAAVKALAKAYGPGLLIVYTADVRVRGGERADPGEERLVAACAQHQVRCVSMRETMLASRRAGHVVRGFQTTTLGVGHLNSKGHELVGRAIWSAVRPQLKRSTVQVADR